MKTLQVFSKHEIEFAKILEAQSNGDYKRVEVNPVKFTKENLILNYIDGLEIKMTDKGRGLFAARDICKDELILVEKALA